MTGRTFLPSFLPVTFVSGLSTVAFAEVPTEAMERFLEQGQAVVAELALDTPDAASVTASIEQMLEDAKPVVTAYGEKYTQCSEQLAKLIELYPQINQWSPQEIRRNIETGMALPPADGCYPARDIVAHPAIVRAFARNGIDPNQRQRLTREMNEALEHMEEISTDLNQ